VAAITEREVWMAFLVGVFEGDHDAWKQRCDADPLGRSQSVGLRRAESRSCDDPMVSAPDDDSLEARLRAIAEEISGSLERAFEQLDLSEITERIGMSSERARELADLAGQWLSEQLGGSEASWSPGQPQERLRGDDSRPRRDGPHPLDVPTEEQGLALSALDSGRWKVDPGTEELIPVGSGADPSQPVGLVGELRARDWIAPSGEVTLVGRDALSRWLDRATPS
jgi:hypothetical protein